MKPDVCIINWQNLIFFLFVSSFILVTYLLGKVLLIAELFYPQRNFEFKYKSIHFGQNEPAKLTLFWIAGEKNLE